MALIGQTLSHTTYHHTLTHQSLATFLQANIPSDKVIATVIGVFSAVIDNVPLVRFCVSVRTTSMY